VSPLDVSIRRGSRVCTLAALCALVVAAAASGTTYKQPGFSETVVLSGLTNPTVVRFLPDGRILVAEKSGLLKMFDSLTDTTPTLVADLRTRTHNFWDRGLLGLAVPPGFDPASSDAWRRYVYVLYARDALPGGAVPKWGTPGATSDPCPAPPNGPGATTDGCVVTGQLSRLLAAGTDWTASEEMLIEGWCQQFPSHSTGSLSFGADEKLYVSGGDGASFNNSDWGQYGGTVADPAHPGTFFTPANPCGDPPLPAGTPLIKPAAEGGALRSQSPRRTSGEPRLLNGTVLRIDPATGLALPDNPLYGSSDPDEQRIIGYGLRNPFRMTVRPNTNEVWIADVGWNTWEELNKIPDLATARNFGWPCFEGNGTQYTGLSICPPQAQTTAPFLTYNHGASVVAGDGCTVGSSSIAGMAFHQSGSNYPPAYANALFFSDYSRKCMWVMFADGSGNPVPASTAAFAAQALGPVDLTTGPDGNLYYADFDGGRIMRVQYGLNAVATGNPLSGTAPLTVDFDGSASQPAQAGDTLTFAWDFDGDGQFDDGAGPTPSYTYTTPGTLSARLKVTDQRGASSISAPLTVSAGNTAPTATIATPTVALTWKVNDSIAFAGSATDPQEGPLPASALSWEIVIHHCPSNCHTHVYQSFDGVVSGTFPAPDHEYPSFLEVRLTATDAQGLSNTQSVNINPQTVSLTFQSAPAGLQLNVGTASGITPFSRTVIVNSQNSLEAPSPQGTFPNIWDYASWSDSGAQSHTITAGAAPATYTATYLTHADLSVSATASPEPVGAGAPLTYTLTVSNAGPSQASSLTVSDALPSGASFVSASGAGWSCSGTGPVTCTLPSLGIASAAPISIVVDAPAAAGTILNNASVTSSTSDPSAANNAAAATSNVFARADLSVTQTGAPAAVCPGQPVTYTLNVSNAGPSTATSIAVADTLPAGSTFVSASGSGWSCSGAGTVTCTRASLAVGAAPAITVSIDAPSAAGPAANAASISSATNDPVAGNNVSNATTTVNVGPTATVSGGTTICQGDSTVLSVALTGTGPWNLHWSDGLVQSTGSSVATRAVSPIVSTIYTVTSVSDAFCTSGGDGAAEIAVGTPVSAPAIVAPLWVPVDAPDQSASVPGHDGSTYAWTVTGGSLVSGQGTSAITFSVGEPGTTMSLSAVETNMTCVSPAGVFAVQVDFLDVPPEHAFHDFVDTIARDRITAGCGNGDYCPDAPNTRAQMAVFLLKAKLGGDHAPPPATGSVFLDVPASDPFAPWIEELASLGVTGGCGGGSYCPGSPVTRAQMAVFLLRTFEGSAYAPPLATGTIFGDVPANAFAAAWIEELYNRGVTSGCQASPLLYCPGNPVTRGQMAVFLSKTFGLSPQP
jgi:uncharacterized repeat protein (TIGR01451 family)